MNREFNLFVLMEIKKWISGKADLTGQHSAVILEIKNWISGKADLTGQHSAVMALITIKSRSTLTSASDHVTYG